MDAQNKRNLILLGHAQSGKTSLAENLLFKCGAISRKGTVLEGNTASDYNFDEIERKSSINASFLNCNYQGTQIQIVDTPGYADFYGDVLSCVRGVDNAVIVVDAFSGVEVGTERAWALAEENNLPRIIFVNKIDKENLDLNKLVKDIKDILSSKAVVLSTAKEDELAELVAESDDQLLEKYLNEGKLSSEEVSQGLGKAIRLSKVFPIVFGSNQSGAGIEELLKIIKDYSASPIYRPALDLQQGEVAFNESSPLTGFVFKNIIDPYVGQLSMVRVFSGKLAANTSFYNVTQKIAERIGQIYFLQGKEQRPIDAAGCGDIVAIPKLKQTQASDSIAEQAHPVIFKPVIYPEAMISASVKPHTRQDEEKISQALAKLVAEDHTFRVKVDQETKEMLISGLGDLHLNVMVNRLKKRFNVGVDLGTPKVPYKETITKIAKVQGKFKRQSGGRGQYGDVWIEVHPLEHGKGFEFVDKIVGGSIPKNFIPSVEKGVRQAMSEGAVSGNPMVDIQVILYDGSFHEVDSSDMAFQRAGSMALRKATLAAGPVLLEPIMEVDVFIPEDFLGQISGDLNQRRGRTTGMEVKGKSQVVKAHVPLAEMFTYANDLRSMTQGKGSYLMKFNHYEQVPAKIASTIIAQYQATRKQEEEE
ncbi:MAG: elongation factor G [Candidatus Omnitrophota bacterium]